MTSTTYQPVLHRFAVATACVALLPIVVGALVTTKDAGMAFRDWPASDGHNMFLYPWLASTGDKFLEHGHRLAGTLVGLFSIGLVVLAWRTEKRRAVRRLAALVLAAVVFQGLVGGLRVLADQRLLALFHGSFAALVFSLMAALALLTGRGWQSVEAEDLDRNVAHLKPLVIVTSIVIFVQFMLGGMLRHLGTALYEHVGLAVLVSLFVMATAVAALVSRIRRLCIPACSLLCLLVLQLCLGAGAWVTRFGFATTGYVAVQHAPPQIVLQTAHTVVGMLLLMSSVVCALEVFRLSALTRRVNARSSETNRLTHAFSMKGGVE